MWPSDGKIVATFDEGKNKGIDIAGRMGQQVMAAGSGKVMYAGSGIRGYGNLVIVKHSNSLLSAYAHNRTILVKEGQNVTKGQPIAEMGDSDADAVKLHFEIRQQGKPVDPAKFLPSR
jgi:lipoprotein NlpD